jgi:hypothetical protein
MQQPETERVITRERYDAVLFDLLDSKCDDVAAQQLAVDCQIEHRQIARPSIHLQSGTDRP